MKRHYGLFLVLCLLVTMSGCSVFSSKGNSVQVKTINSGYELFVNNAPFYIKGVGAGEAFGKKGENYLALAKELGANVVRTWGTDQGTQKYLDEAHRQGLLV